MPAHYLPAPRTVIAAASVDVVLVIVFAVIGRASHHEDLSTVGIAVTLWPFLVALAVGWLVTRAWRAPLAPLRAGVGVWVVTVAGGMLLRLASGQGVQFAFVIVATLVLGLFLLGWRAVAALVRRMRRARVRA